ncbi:ArdC-like ssDNA-binding domain-containing protein, partial [Granulicatella balaenopterae]
TDQNLLMNQKIISADVMNELAKDIVKVNSSKNDMLYTIYMNGHNQPINIMQADYSDMNIHDFQTLQQKIVLHGIENSAAKMILVHNGSQEIDSKFLHHTCYNAGLANISVLDCIEVNGHTSYSLREKGETIFSSSYSNEPLNNETNLNATEYYVNHLMVNEQKATYKTKKDYKRTSEQEKNARVQEASERVLKQVDDFIVDPKLVIDYIKWKKQFPSYSFNNTLLIYSQNRNATAVGSYSMWKQKGVAVKRGEKGMKIFAPIIVKELLDKEKQVVTTLGKASKQQKELLKMGVLTEKDRVASYTTTSVFDIAQTTATLDMYPEIVKRGYEKESDIDFSKYNHALHTVMEEHHITFTDDNLNNSYQTLGYCIPTENKIFLQSNLSNVARFKTLTHELAHGLLHKNSTLSSKEKEFQAQMVSNVVSEVLGVPIKEYDISYVKSWSESLAPENKKALMRGVIDTADLMLDSYDNTLEAFNTNKLTMKEKEIAKQLEIIDNPAFSINDIKEITHYPASEKLTASYTRDKIINKRAKLTADEELKFNEDNMLFLRKKVIDNEHVFYHIDDVTELMIATSQRKNEVEFNYYSVTGEITSQEVAGLDDAIKILHQKGAIPVSENAMEYKKLADKNMERNRTLTKQRNQIKQTMKENTLERTL